MEKLFLIDGSSYFFRAYFALPPMSTSKGLPTHAILGFTNMLLKVLEDHKPDYLVVAFDSRGPTFRDEKFSEYKAQREEMPEDLAQQLPYIQEVLNACHISTLAREGYEADDLIGTLCKKYKGELDEVVIVSGDKDFMQLIDEKVKLLDTMKERLYQRKEVAEKFGVAPELVADVMGLAGDKIDNIPGVPGIGIKTAAELIQKFGSLETLLSSIEEVEGAKRKENLKKHADSARLSKELFLIHCDVEIDASLEAFSRKEIDREALLELFKKLEFYGLIKRLSLRDRESAPPLAEREVVRDRDSLERWREEIIEGGIVSIDTETTGLDEMSVLLVGISLCIPQKKKLKSAYIPIGHKGPDAVKQLDLAQIRELLGSVVSDPRILKVGQNAKYDILVLRRHGLPMEGLAFDTMVASYLLNPEGKHNLDDLSLEYMNYHTTSYSDLVPRGSTFADVSVDAGADYSCQDAEVTYSLFKIFESLLEREGLSKLFRDVENPLVLVLAAMEYKGVKIDVPFLKGLSEEIASELAVLEEKIYSSAGEQFNINSSRQLSTLLFEKLRLPVLKSTKTGYSTDTDVLNQLKHQHSLPGLILEYRELAKLKSTYVDPLPKGVHPETGRIHTSYNQTMTATGRLSSSEPNLQNIPLRTERGRRLREAFIAEEGNLLISADYSQIELRLLAHLSEDPALIEAFQQGEDIHNRTASELFGVPSGAVTSEMRRMAKVINFGILYGMSAGRLSRDLDIPKKEAESFIERYFSRFSRVRAYLDGSIEQARRTGAVTTILNRRRYLPDIQSSNPMLRMNAERMAMNMPIQGSAADLIKIAMVRIHEELLRQRLPAEMIMQVHDELILEADEQMASEAAEILREQMEGAVKLKVPLKVEVRSGKNWRALSH